MTAAAGRVVLVACSPHTPAGMLSWPAWQALREGPALTGAADHPQRAHLKAAGVHLEHVSRPAVLNGQGGAGLMDPDRTLAGELFDRARGGQVVWLTSGDEDDGLVRALGELAVRGGAEVEVVYGSWDAPGARLLDVVAIMDRLRSPGGCPWDAAQTHASLRTYLLEEAYEAYQALEEGDTDALREELGDVLLQVVFHARIASELSWTIDDVAGDLVDKLVRRHPHVFAGGSADDLEGSWDALKAAEKDRSSVTDGVPMTQPALMLAAKLQRRSAKLGAPTGSYEDLGGELWTLVARCQEAGLDPEQELRAVARRHRDALAALEAQLRAEGRDPVELTTFEWEQRWA